MKKLLIAIAVLASSMAACTSSATEAGSFHHGQYVVDTVVVHGHAHEVIYSIQGKSAFHSPECWCFLEDWEWIDM